jgi:hypothetical protein
MLRALAGRVSKHEASFFETALAAPPQDEDQCD